MRMLTTISALFLSTFLWGQIVVPSDSQRVENSKRNYRYALFNKGKKVGNGLCRELVYKAVKLSHKNDLTEVLTNACLFEIKDRNSIIKGDIVTFKNVIYRDDMINYHTGIIIGITESGFFYAHQNMGTEYDETEVITDENGKECNVFKGTKVEAQYFEYKDLVGGVIQFFRF